MFNLSFHHHTKSNSNSLFDEKSSDSNDKLVKTLWKLQKIILDTLEFESVSQLVCDVLLQELHLSKLGYRIVVLSLIDEKSGQLKRVAFSHTQEAINAVKKLPVTFHQINVPLSAKDNILIRTINTKSAQMTHSWHDLMLPIVCKDDAERIQSAVGIKTSLVYPLIVRNTVIGTMIFSLTKHVDAIQNEEANLLGGFVDIVALSVKNANLYRSLENSRDKLKKANARLRELDRMKDEFVSLASHELRTPLTSIKYNLWMTLQGKAGHVSEKQKMYLERAYSSTNRLTKMVNDMLNISRIESNRIILNPFRSKLDAIVEDVVEEIRPRSKELGVRLVIASHAVKPDSTKQIKLPEVIIDRDKIKEVLVNLIGNSLKFTPKDGQIRVWFEVESDFVWVHVTDSGIGFDPTKTHELFKKFGMIRESYAAYKDASQGTGLGLYICKSIINLHGGQIKAHSPGTNQGATFSFSVPIYSEQLKKHFAREFAGKTDAGIIMTQVMAE